MEHSDISLRRLLDRIAAVHPRLSGQLRMAAKFALDSPVDIAMISMRGAAAAGVAPATMLRLAKSLGFSGYAVFRRIFQEAMRGGDFSGKAERLAGGGSAGVVSAMRDAAFANLRATFTEADAVAFARSADLLRRARRVFVVAKGAINAVAAYFHHVCRMALDNAAFSPIEGLMADEIAGMRRGDLLVAISFAPYARETVDLAAYAAGRGVAIIVVTDSRASPLARFASELILVRAASPQFFPSQVAVVAVMETLIALLVSRAGNSAVEKIAEIESLRESLGTYIEFGKKRPHRRR